ncbi:gamma-glutamyl-gamma-aminobutyrate hydrolase family protein [Fructilactobacillus cliffordii]|uniref:Gamma-glutamyl-gamma-aminobutyrate hydrolase family protein n=1 Tax=Fructilactobacillus cliffordii TaxID=2940299 RepID=A0A9Q9E0D2_9LACO|nr:gamma-glutamyl-gamma-aminobutyrate hydrolase family protein [Fructilactobacillus cliffordii]USS86014.1 gamma-glutamyl-gamma-aminobutyrate hydrolase family protein [Fructilactobacillus cliffordii]USS89091.1 gamma-glutamyl-gamma-aminobutyrate hydrolase family protein [Fructilactobacillus cliffordii]
MKVGIAANINRIKTDNFNLDYANYTARVFIDVLRKHDVVPVIIPMASPEMIPDYVDIIDGLIIPGGQDVHPQLFSENSVQADEAHYLPHDRWEMGLIEEMMRQHKPILGICRGLQIINVALGGSLHQDVATDFPSSEIEHVEFNQPQAEIHEIAVDTDSGIAHAMGTNPQVNSIHHQALKQVAAPLHVTARATDGVIEAAENDDATVVGVQWHPELMWEVDHRDEQLFLDFFARIQKQLEQ